MASSVQAAMRGRPYRYAVYFLFFFVGVNARSYSSSLNSRNLLHRLQGTHSSEPVVVFLNLDGTPRSSEFEELFDQEGDDGLLHDEDESDKEQRLHHDSSSSHEDNSLYYLNHLLRDILDKLEDSSASSGSELELPDKTKQALRTALRARCRKVDRCVQKCPPKKPSCPSNCQQVFDDMNLCPPPPTTPNPCKKPRCGKTMPPRWKL